MKAALGAAPLGARSISVLLIFIVSLAVAFPDTAYACKCVPPGSPSEELTRSTAVFSGKVLRLEPEFPKPTVNSADPVKLRVQVTSVWKGRVPGVTLITTTRGEASCGYYFKNDLEYLMYANGSENELTVSLCSRTKLMSASSEDLTALGAGKKPAAVNSDKAGSKRSDLMALLFLIFQVIAIAAMSMVYKRRKVRNVS